MEWRPLKVWVKSIYSSTGIMEDYSYRYIVSENGDIKDIIENKIVNYKISKDYPYKNVLLTDINGKEHKRLVHRIVATTFNDICGEINEVVNHLDENKLNNNATNLHWCTYDENFNYGTARQRAKENYKKYLEKKKLEKNIVEPYVRPQLISIE